MILQVLVYGILAGLLYAVISLGFSLIYSGTRIFHIAYGSAYVVAPYLYMATYNIFSVQLGLTGWFCFPMSIACALAGASLLGYATEIMIYRPLLNRKSAPLIFFISSLGLYIICVNLIAMIFGNETLVLNKEIEPSFTFRDIVLTRIQLIQVGVSLLLLGCTLVIVQKTSIGRKIRGLADNSILLSVLGVDTKKIRSIIFLLGSFLAASAALVTSFDVGIDPQVGFSIVLTATVAVIIGTVGSHYGAIAGAMLIGIIQNLVMWFASAQWKDAATFLILIIILLIRKEGLFVFSKRVEE